MFRVSPLSAVPALGDPFASIDGSLGAPVGGFQQSDFFTSHALQSTQTYATRPPWKVAGVDYPVGIPSSVTLKDPSTASLPTGVTYNATDPGFAYNTPVVVVTGNNVTVDSLDFSLKNGIGLYVTGATGTLTIQNCKFRNGSNYQGNPYFDGTNLIAAMIQIDIGTGNTCNLIWQNCDIELNAGAGVATAGAPDVIRNWSTGTTTIQYNVIRNLSGRLYYGPGAFLMQFNYFENQNYSSGAHGEWTIFNLVTTTGLTIPSIKAMFNTMLQGNQYLGGMTAPIYASSGTPADNLTISLVDVEYNTCVINGGICTASCSGTTLNVTACPTGGAGGNTNQLGGGDRLLGINGVTATQISAGPGGTGAYTIGTSQNFGSQTVYIGTVSCGLVEIGGDTDGTFIVKNNYMDPTGVAAPGQLLVGGSGNASSFIESGNINLVTGSAIT